MASPIIYAITVAGGGNPMEAILYVIAVVIVAAITVNLGARLARRLKVAKLEG